MPNEVAGSTAAELPLLYGAILECARVLRKEARRAKQVAVEAVLQPRGLGGLSVAFSTQRNTDGANVCHGGS